MVVRADDNVETVFRHVLKNRRKKPFLRRTTRRIGAASLAVCNNPIVVLDDGRPEPRFFVARSSAAATLFADISNAARHFHDFASLDSALFFENALTKIFANTSEPRTASTIPGAPSIMAVNSAAHG